MIDIADDGCTVIGTQAGITTVIGVDGAVQLGLVRSATLAPDGRAVVIQTNTGEVQFVQIDDGTLREPDRPHPPRPRQPHRHLPRHLTPFTWRLRHAVTHDPSDVR